MSVEYRVIWEIDVDVPSPLEAALEAESIQRDQVTGACPAGEFTVIRLDNLESTDVDLSELYSNKNLEV